MPTALFASKELLAAMLTIVIEKTVGRKVALGLFGFALNLMLRSPFGLSNSFS
mgnify:CR=1 FL=1